MGKERFSEADLGLHKWHSGYWTIKLEIVISNICWLNLTSHILPTAHRRLYFSMAFRAFCYMNITSIWLHNCTMCQLLVTLTASHRTDTHSTFFTRIFSHDKSLSKLHFKKIDAKYYLFFYWPAPIFPGRKTTNIWYRLISHFNKGPTGQSCHTPCTTNKYYISIFLKIFVVVRCAWICGKLNEASRDPKCTFYCSRFIYF